MSEIDGWEKNWTFRISNWNESLCFAQARHREAGTGWVLGYFDGPLRNTRTEAEAQADLVTLKRMVRAMLLAKEGITQDDMYPHLANHVRETQEQGENPIFAHGALMRYERAAAKIGEDK